ncbi:MAG TPA: riboflavin synthase, partial [Candidatus Deferrimicrobium sp.]|nr:riboflavin synthase [Candidatus Deferrimicrobium sp.]
CLTVVSVGSGRFSVEASQETVRRTIAPGYKTGSRINLERAIRAGDRMGGHFVTGHVDDTGIVDYVHPVGESLELAVSFAPRFDKLVIEKGSIAINGVSLTVNTVHSGRLSVNLVPFTVKETTLGGLGPGDRVNLEFDLIGKFVLKSRGNIGHSDLTVDKLIETGW